MSAPLKLRHPSTRSSRAGITMVEVMVAIVILTVSVYILSSTVTAAIGHSGVKRERGLAVDGTMNLFEQMRAEPFEELFARYNSDPGDDPDGPGTAPGAHFTVQGLDPQAEDGDGFVGEIILPRLDTRTASQLREDIQDPSLSMPRDLNGDLIIDGEDHAQDYIVLPITLRLSWEGRSGRRSFEMSSMLSHLEKAD